MVLGGLDFLSLNNVKLNRVQSHKHLGVTLSHDMKWNPHIDLAINKATKRLNGIRRIRFLITRGAREILYKALVLPILEYGNVLYDNCSLYLKQRLESVQRQAAVICSGSFRTTSYNKLLTELGWPTLDLRRKLARLSILYKMVNNQVPDYLCNLVPSRVGDRVGYALRNAGNIGLVKTKHVKTYNSFIPKTIRDWNNLKFLHNASSLDSFKARFKKEFFGDTNPFFKIDIDGGNIPHTRLRLGLSHLSSHLFTYNLINDPTCRFCGVESETISHYLLRCPTYHVQRVTYLTGLIQTLNGP